MSESSHEEFRTLWRELARRNSWELVEDETAFLDQAIAEFPRLTSKSSLEELRRLAVYRAYARRLYEGVENKQPRATTELISLLREMALNDGCSLEEAQDLAHETIARVLAKLSTVRDQGSFIDWAGMILLRVKIKNSKTRAEVPFRAAADDTTTYDPPDPHDVATEVIDDIIARDLLALLRAHLRNELDWQIVLRGVVLGEKSIDIAKTLEVTYDSVRLRKSRAIGRLRKNKRFVQALANLTGRSDPAADNERSR